MRRAAEPSQRSIPRNGGELASVAQAGTDDVDAAVTAARTAFDGAWAKTAPAKRARMLNSTPTKPMNPFGI